MTNNIECATVSELVRALRDKGCAVTIFSPNELRGMDAQDMQDALVDFGESLLPEDAEEEDENLGAEESEDEPMESAEDYYWDKMEQEFYDKEAGL